MGTMESRMEREIELIMADVWLSDEEKNIAINDVYEEARQYMRKQEERMAESRFNGYDGDSYNI